ncbi:MAG TPA: hypothetical protein VH395_03460, partial [Jatrophihabitantaceae bacterium]
MVRARADRRYVLRAIVRSTLLALLTRLACRLGPLGMLRPRLLVGWSLLRRIALGPALTGL